MAQHSNRAAYGKRKRWERPVVARTGIGQAEGPLGPLGDGFGGQDIVS